MSTNRPEITGRSRQIVDIVTASGPLRVEELAQKLAVSIVTVYRDLAKLEKLDLVTRSKGEVSPARSSLSEMPTDMRSKLNPGEKAEIAAAAAHLITRGESVMVDDSSTVLPLLDRVADLSPLTIITNALTVVQKVGSNPGTTVFMMGGRYRLWTDSFHGPSTVEAIKKMRADVCVMSDAAITGSSVCNPHEFVADTKRAMLAVSARKILLADHTKFARRALHEVVPLSAFDTVVVDSQTPEETIDRLEGEVETVIVAPSLDG
ncbi:MAG: DeoR/GlpR family DNA-binding transcription regulator [Ancrocorticia sp.]|uniref:DeoR/GlpR family DNA-binding transcription regulator n=1 Tax=Ancrocorticia sp. TaxID=2593684 RepID=UPI003F936EAB